MDSKNLLVYTRLSLLIIFSSTALRTLVHLAQFNIYVHDSIQKPNYQAHQVKSQQRMHHTVL